ncbi:MAG: MurR/RpiR family transcriptional regulator [Beutenbergiaceae bacterium]
MPPTQTRTQGGGVLAVLRGKYPGMTATDKKIADLILEDPGSILRAPVAEIATRSGSSQAAVSRFASRLGFGRLTDLKIGLALDVASGEGNGQSHAIDVADSMPQVLHKIASDNIQVIRDTLEVLSRTELERAVDALRGASRIVILGVGQMGYLASDAALKFRTVGRQAVAASDYIEQLALSQAARSDDAFLIVSHAGIAPPVVYGAEAAKAAGATVIGICHAGRPALAEHLDVQLSISADGAQFRTAAQAARVAIATLIDTLVVGLLARDGAHAMHFAEFNELLGSEQLE